MKKITAIFFQLFIGMSLFASTTDNDLVVWFINGNCAVISLTEKPNITFTNEEMHISCKNQIFSYDINTIGNFSYTLSANSLSETEISYKITINSKEELQISGLIGNNTIKIFDIKGLLLYSTISKDNTIRIPLKQHNSEYIVIRINDKSFKIITK